MQWNLSKLFQKWFRKRYFWNMLESFQGSFKISSLKKFLLSKIDSNTIQWELFLWNIFKLFQWNLLERILSGHLTCFWKNPLEPSWKVYKLPQKSSKKHSETIHAVWASIISLHKQLEWLLTTFLDVVTEKKIIYPTTYHFKIWTLRVLHMSMELRFWTYLFEIENSYFPKIKPQ